MPKKARKSDPTAAFNQAWQVSMDIVKPLLKLKCPTCGRRTVCRMLEGDPVPWCLKCMDKAFFRVLGLKRMVVVGKAKEPKEQTVSSWMPQDVGKIAFPKSKK